jgi:hypothetical protein
MRAAWARLSCLSRSSWKNTIRRNSFSHCCPTGHRKADFLDSTWRSIMVNSSGGGGRQHYSIIRLPARNARKNVNIAKTSTWLLPSTERAAISHQLWQILPPLFAHALAWQWIPRHSCSQPIIPICMLPYESNALKLSSEASDDRRFTRISLPCNTTVTMAIFIHSSNASDSSVYPDMACTVATWGSCSWLSKNAQPMRATHRSMQAWHAVVTWGSSSCLSVFHLTLCYLTATESIQSCTRMSSTVASWVVVTDAMAFTSTNR